MFQRRLEHVAGGAGRYAGRRRRLRGGGAADVAPRDRLAADQADRSRGGAGVHQAPPVPGDRSRGSRTPGWRPAWSAAGTAPAGVVHASSTVPVPDELKARWATGWATPPDAAGSRPARPVPGGGNSHGPAGATLTRPVGRAVRPVSRRGSVGHYDGRGTGQAHPLRRYGDADRRSKTAAAFSLAGSPNWLTRTIAMPLAANAGTIS